MNIFSYVVRYDIGFAPNPFHGHCTLACCKPGIRKSAKAGDLVIGTTSRAGGKPAKLLYMMKVTEVSDFNSYWTDSRFQNKKPNLRSSKKIIYGDNIYYHDGQDWQQADSRHSELDGSRHEKHLKRDTGTTQNVLISEDFVYFGRSGYEIPDDLSFCIQKWQGYRKKFLDEEKTELESWFNSMPKGIHGFPSDWYPKNSRS